ncbi:MAG: hypothetical protein M3367_15740 [Acidobacteriota bacterium]|nr:hypothetical protein [Acidobacteriota bacterium]
MLKQKFLWLTVLCSLLADKLLAQRTKQQRRTDDYGLWFFDYERSVGEGNLSGVCR